MRGEVIESIDEFFSLLNEGVTDNTMRGWYRKPDLGERP